MSFITYNVQYIKKYLEIFENSPITKENIYLAKQLLKFVQDLVDEDYLDLHNDLVTIDKRVDFRMFTTSSQFYPIYKDKIFTNAYEKNRWFETLYSQDKLMIYHSYENGLFYIQECLNETVQEEAKKEMKQMIGDVE